MYTETEPQPDENQPPRRAAEIEARARQAEKDMALLNALYRRQALQASRRPGGPLQALLRFLSTVR